jgi:hypothetical protein
LKRAERFVRTIVGGTWMRLITLSLAAAGALALAACSGGEDTAATDAAEAGADTGAMAPADGSMAPTDGSMPAGSGTTNPDGTMTSPDGTTTSPGTAPPPTLPPEGDTPGTTPPAQ